MPRKMRKSKTEEMFRYLDDFESVHVNKDNTLRKFNKLTKLPFFSFLFSLAISDKSGDFKSY